MAPSILQLEVTRIGKVLAKPSLAIDDRNAFVRVRYAMTKFIECIVTAQKDTIQATCEPLLTNALLSMPEPKPDFDLETTQTIDYIVDRLHYVLHRIPLIY